MNLQKIYRDLEFSSAVIPAGQQLFYHGYVNGQSGSTAIKVKFPNSNPITVIKTDGTGIGDYLSATNPSGYGTFTFNGNATFNGSVSASILNATTSNVNYLNASQYLRATSGTINTLYIQNALSGFIGSIDNFYSLSAGFNEARVTENIYAQDFITNGEVNKLSQKLNQKAIVTDTSSSSLNIDLISGNTTYKFGTLTSLTITNIQDSDYQSIIYFTAGGSITVNLPSYLQFIGEATFEASTKYVISILNNVAVVGKIGE